MALAKRYLLAILLVCFFSIIFHGLNLVSDISWRWVYSDTLGFYDRAIAPGFPYLDKLIEYPVLTGVFIQLMGWLGQSRAGYYAFSSLFLLLFFLGTTYFLYKTIPDQNKKRLWQFWIFAPSMFFFAVYNWDILAIFFTVLAFYFAQKNEVTDVTSPRLRRGAFFNKNADSWAAFFLALGFSAKFFPILFLLPLLLKNYSNVLKNIRIAGIFIITALVINLPFALINFDGWSYFFTLNSSRSPNLDSIWTVIRWLFPSLDDVQRINFLSLSLFSLTYLWLIWKNRKEDLIKLCFIATLLFLIFNKVFTPQYVLWLLPFLAILPFNRSIRPWFYTLEFSNLIILFLTLSWFFTGKDMAYFYWDIPFILLRHLTLIALTIIVIKTESQL